MPWTCSWLKEYECLSCPSIDFDDSFRDQPINRFSRQFIRPTIRPQPRDQKRFHVVHQNHAHLSIRIAEISAS